jgi:YidC/Oxa1 family membrane protein insertase
MLAFAPLDGAVGAAYHVVSGLAAGVGAAAAIVVLTVAVRLLLSPLSYVQTRNNRRLAALGPRIEDLRRRHRKDPTRLGAELSTLYRDEGVSPYGGCLPVLLQAPLFFVLYRLFTATTVAGGPNHLLSETLYGVPLGTHLSGALAYGVLSPPVLAFAVLFAALAGLAWLASRRMARTALAAGGSPGSPPAARLMRLLPYGTLLAAAVVPLAAGIYLVTTNAWTALEATILSLGR